jgi:hypothetical protein
MIERSNSSELPDLAAAATPLRIETAPMPHSL